MALVLWDSRVFRDRVKSSYFCLIIAYAAGLFCLELAAMTWYLEREIVLKVMFLFLYAKSLQQCHLIFCRFHRQCILINVVLWILPMFVFFSTAGHQKTTKTQRHILSISFVSFFTSIECSGDILYLWAICSSRLSILSRMSVKSSALAHRPRRTSFGTVNQADGDKFHLKSILNWPQLAVRIQGLFILLFSHCFSLTRIFDFPRLSQRHSS